MRRVDPTYGTVSEGSMRIQDRLPACMDVLLEYNPGAYQEVTSTISTELGTTYTELCGNHTLTIWDTELMWWLLYYVVDEAMNKIAPDGYYFGAHPGDGADYGFWACEDQDEEGFCFCCGKGNKTLVPCPICEKPLCQDCGLGDFGPHICEPDAEPPLLYPCTDKELYYDGHSITG